MLFKSQMTLWLTEGATARHVTCLVSEKHVVELREQMKCLF
jgi:hypothetical protein